MNPHLVLLFMMLDAFHSSSFTRGGQGANVTPNMIVPLGVKINIHHPQSPSSVVDAFWFTSFAARVQFMGRAPTQDSESSPARGLRAHVGEVPSAILRGTMGGKSLLLEDRSGDKTGIL